MVQYIGECKEMGLAVLPADVNESDIFSLSPRAHSGPEPGGRQIRFGMAAIKNVGEGASRPSSLAQGGRPFKSLFDFCDRVDLRAVNRRVVESFIKSGASTPSTSAGAALFAGHRQGHGVRAEAAARPRAGPVEPFGMLGIDEGRGAERVERVPDAPSGRERAARLREGDAGLLHQRPSARALPRRHRAVGDHTTAGLADITEPQEVVMIGIITGLRLLKTRRATAWRASSRRTRGQHRDARFPKTYADVAAALADDVVVLVKGAAEAQEDAKPKLLGRRAHGPRAGQDESSAGGDVRVPMGAWGALESRAAS
jgi:DNA polymerase-3 subunit alpha